ncbi:MAG: amidohydrolase family protein [Planctomycetaceae bacterium]|nr:amidohydrolase family protein [Planctomycetaceae bacterium]
MTNVDGGVGVGGILEKKYINVSDKIILSVSGKPEFKHIVDYGKTRSILPAMINSHAHLELNQLKSPIKLPEIENNYHRHFDQWLQNLIQFRKSSTYNSIKAIAEARKYFLDNKGTGAIVDIVPFGVDFGGKNIGDDILWLRFPEVIAWDSKTVKQKIKQINKLPKENFDGLSPHAPQTVSGEVLEFLVGCGVTISMHLAESADEIQLLQTRDGKLLNMMRRFDENYDPSKVLVGRRAMDYLKLLSRAPRALVVHGNYLDETEIQFLAKHNQTMAIVYTPRSHDYFGFREFPLKRLLDAGVRVFLGTDSKASTPDLNLTNEINHAIKIHPQIPLETFLQMTTTLPATFLNLTKDYGTIESGKIAAFSLIKLPK